MESRKMISLRDNELREGLNLFEIISFMDKFRIYDSDKICILIRAKNFFFRHTSQVL